MPSCTLMVWGDDRTIDTVAIAQGVELRGWRLPGESTAFVLQLAPAAADALRTRVPELPSAVEWLEVRPRTTSASWRLDHAVEKQRPTWPVPRTIPYHAPVTVAAFRDPPAAA